MGHKGCGAVKAVCEAGNKPLHDHLRELQKHMTDVRRLVAEAHGKQPPGLMDVLCQENAKHQALALLRDSPFLQHAVQKRQARIVYAFYDMESGVVDFFDFR
jgi:carbonic anhydrase